METSKFLRIGGRGSDGNAKPISTDNAGNINIVSKANNPQSGEAVNITPVQDPDTGLWYMGTAIVGHVAYDEVQDKFRADSRRESSLLAEYEIDHSLRSAFITGENTVTTDVDPITPINTSRLQDLTIVIRNDQDTDSWLRVFFLKDQTPYSQSSILSNTVDRLIWPPGTDGLHETNNEVRITAGETYRVHSYTIPQIVAPYPAMVLRFARNAIPSSGSSIKITIFGR